MELNILRFYISTKFRAGCRPGITNRGNQWGASAKHPCYVCFMPPLFESAQCVLLPIQWLHHHVVSGWDNATTELKEIHKWMCKVSLCHGEHDMDHLCCTTLILFLLSILKLLWRVFTVVSCKHYCSFSLPFLPSLFPSLSLSLSRLLKNHYDVYLIVEYFGICL